MIRGTELKSENVFRNVEREQEDRVCQMAYFQTKNSNFG
jgi:hypothetical protein